MSKLRSLDELVRRLAEGDSTVLSLLVESLHPIIRRACVRESSRDAELAEEAIGEACLRIWKQLPRHASAVQDLEAWTVRVAQNVCRDIRRASRRTSAAVDRLASLAQSPVAEVQPPPPEMSHLLEWLTPLYRDAFRLRVVEASSYRDIAITLGITESTARKRVQVARHRLLAVLGSDLSRLHSKVAERDSLQSCPAVPDLTRIHRYPEDSRSLAIAEPASGTRRVEIPVPYTLARRPCRQQSLRDYIARHPHGWRKRLELALLEMARGNWEGCFKEFRLVLERRPDLVGVRARQGEILEVLGRDGEAADVYREAEARSKRPIDALHLRGRIEMCEGNLPEAAGSFAAACRLNPNNGAHWYRLGLAQQRRGRPDLALPAYDHAIQLNPGDGHAMLRSHDALVALGRIDEAMERAAAAAAVLPESVIALNACAAHRGARGWVTGEQGGSTRSLLERARRLAPDSAEVCQGWACFHIRRGAWGLARRVLGHHTQRYPDDADGWYNLSHWTYATRGELSAISSARRATRMAAGNPLPGRLLLDCLVRAGRHKQVLRLAGSLRQAFGRDPYTLTAIASAVARLGGQDSLSLALTDEALGLNPQLHITWLVRGRVLARMGRAGDAYSAQKRCWDVAGETHCPESAESALHLAELHHERGETKPAVQWSRRALEVGREIAQYYPHFGLYYQACAHERLGSIREAACAYRAALDNHLTYPLRGFALARLEALVG